MKKQEKESLEGKVFRIDFCFDVGLDEAPSTCDCSIVMSSTFCRCDNLPNIGKLSSP